MVEQHQTISMMVNKQLRKVDGRLPRLMRGYVPAQPIYEDIDDDIEVSWVDSIDLKQVKIPEYPSHRLVDGIFSGYVDTNGEPVAGYFVFDKEDSKYVSCY